MIQRFDLLHCRRLVWALDLQTVHHLLCLRSGPTPAFIAQSNLDIRYIPSTICFACTATPNLLSPCTQTPTSNIARVSKSYQLGLMSLKPVGHPGRPPWSDGPREDRGGSLHHPGLGNATRFWRPMSRKQCMVFGKTLCVLRYLVSNESTASKANKSEALTKE